ncbi:cellulose synthase catalytic subunit (UDP-forming) [Leptospirillum ferriphilum ML-04]|uniref:Cellulose synthase catalytic subunit (UDP-forming) n=1 Tax=Leptospirillum ferriphilum (strain ML-04) TaxID=1048260 RepID=J9ZAQ3_LEPFM|nr:cellulose synthase catalytic subunit (UDP-forming) [Leptospirillum ferriphilum ML-04]
MNRPWTAKTIRSVVLIPITFLIFFLATIPVPNWQTQLWLGTFLFLAALLLKIFLDGKRWVILTLITLSFFSTLRYAWWRTTETLGTGDPKVHWYEYPFIFLLFGAELYSWIILVLGYLQTAYPRGRKADPLPPDPESWPTVDILIPTYNEPLAVVRTTVLAALNMDWPPEKKKSFCSMTGTGRNLRPLRRKPESSMSQDPNIAMPRPETSTTPLRDPTANMWPCSTVIMSRPVLSCRQPSAFSKNLLASPSFRLRITSIPPTRTSAT